MTDQPQGPTPPPEQPSAAPEPQQPASAPPPQQADAAAPPSGATAVPPQPAYGAPPQAAYGQQPAYPPAANPYGGYAQAPTYAGGRPMHPGSIGYVEQYFGPVATFGQRALALIIDMLLTLIGLVPMVVGIIIVSVAAASAQTGVYDEYGSPVVGDVNGGAVATGVVLIVVGGLLMIAISLWNRVFRMGRTGQSVGKKAMGLKLVDDRSGQPIGAGMCFLREIVSSIVNQVVYLSYLWMLWDDNRQTLADKAVHSTVVVLPRQG